MMTTQLAMYATMILRQAKDGDVKHVPTSIFATLATQMKIRLKIYNSEELTLMSMMSLGSSLLTNPLSPSLLVSLCKHSIVCLEVNNYVRKKMNLSAMKGISFLEY